MKSMSIDDLLAKIPLDNKTFALIGLVCATLVYTDYAFLIKSQQRAVKATVTKIATTDADITRAKNELARSKNSPAASAGPVRIKTLIKDEQVPELLQDIYGLATRNKVSVAQITPVKETVSKDSKRAPGAEGVTTLVITLDTTGDYHKFGALLADLENYGNYIEVDEFKISRNATNYLQQDAQFTLKTYVKK